MVKKKSKFRHIAIDKKKYYFYEIKWLDILGDSGHATSKEFDLMQPALMTTTGYVYSKDKKGKIILCRDQGGPWQNTKEVDKNLGL